MNEENKGKQKTEGTHTMQRDTSPHVQHDRRQTKPSYNTSDHNQADTAQSIPSLVQPA